MTVIRPTVTINANTAMQSMQDAIRAQLAALKNYVPATSGNRIKLEGSGDGRVFVLPDGKMSKGPINAIILSWIWVNRWDKAAWKAGVVTEPSCIAFGRSPTGMIPDPAKSQAVKHTDCDSCLMNKFGSHRSGGNGKDCKNAALFAIVPVDATPNTTPWLIKVSATGIKGFTAYVNYLAKAKGLLPLQVVTEIKMRPNTNFTTLDFGGEEPHDKLDVMFKLQDAANALLAENLIEE